MLETVRRLLRERREFDPNQPGKLEAALGAVLALVAGVVAFVVSTVGLDDLRPLERIALVLGATALAVVYKFHFSRRWRLRELLKLGERCTVASVKDRTDRAALGLKYSDRARTVSRNGEATYVTRDLETALIEAARRYRVLVLHGQVSCGKTRTAWSVVKAIAPSSNLLVVKKPAEGRAHPISEALFLLGSGFRRRRAEVLWIDDLGSYLSADPFDPKLLRDWLKGHPDRYLIATLSSAHLEQLTKDPSGPSEALGELLGMGKKCEIPVAWEGEDFARALADYPGAGTACTRLTRYLDFTDDHIRQARGARRERPAADAVIRAACDWRRCGMNRSIPKQWLGLGIASYLPGTPSDEERERVFELGLGWALDNRGLDEGILRIGDSADEFIIDEGVVREEHRDIPAPIWELIVSHADDVEAVVVAATAQKQGLPEIARRIVGPMVDNPAVSSAASASARRLWRDLHDPPSAALAFQADAATGEPILTDESVPPRRRHGPLAWCVDRPLIWGSVRFLVLLAFDVVALWAALILAKVVTQLGSDVDLSAARTGADLRIPYVGLLVAILFWRSGLYRGGGRRGGTSRALAALTQAAVALTCLRLLAGPKIGSPTLILSTYLFACATVSMERGVFAWVARFLTRQALGHRMRSLLVGSTAQVEPIGEALAGPRRDIIGFAGPAPHRGRQSTLVHLGVSRRMEQLIVTYDIDELVICDDQLTEEELTHLARIAQRQKVRLRSLTAGRNFLVALNRYLPGEPVPLEELRLPVLDGGQIARKRTFDLIAASLLLIILSPVLVTIAVLVKLTSRGPITQHRSQPGLGEQLFVLRKFRCHHLRADGQLGDQTLLGSFLEWCALDELPGLFSVLSGDMSLVGPRPIKVGQYEQLEEWHRHRYGITPGITGLWQVSGRRDTPPNEMVRLDLYYVQRWSVFLDIEILFKTVRAAFGHRATLALTETALTTTTTTERRAMFGDMLLGALRTGQGFEDIIRIGRIGGGHPQEVMAWLSSVQRLGWLDVKGENGGGVNRTNLQLTADAVSYLGHDPRIAPRS
jgi:lipopolysaccharide/colanic/teichoic acid biosynthesis glycosyltransferase